MEVTTSSLNEQKHNTLPVYRVNDKYSITLSMKLKLYNNKPETREGIRITLSDYKNLISVLKNVPTQELKNINICKDYFNKI